MSDGGNKPGRTLGQAIDAIIEALRDLDTPTRTSAIRAACEYLAVPQPQNVERQSDALLDDVGRTPGVVTRSTDIRALKDEKQPTSANEMAALVAFYLQELAGEPERKNEVDVSDMEKYFKQALFPLSKSKQMILINAKAGGYFESLGGGKFRLNPVGYNLVAHNMPRQNVSAGQRRTKKRVTKKSTGRKAR